MHLIALSEREHFVHKVNKVLSENVDVFLDYSSIYQIAAIINQPISEIKPRG
jgi:hypothetical protein